MQTNKSLVICLALLVMVPVGFTLYSYWGVAKGDDIPTQKPLLTQLVREQTQEAEKLDAVSRVILSKKYDQALRQYEELSMAGVRGLGKRKLLCLIYDGKLVDGLSLLKKLSSTEITASDRAALKIVLAIGLRNNREFQDGLAEWKRAAVRTDLADGDDTDAHFLMRVAIGFGQVYDRKCMFLVAREALTRGKCSTEDLMDYAWYCRVNGDFREARRIYVLASKSAATSDRKAAAIDRSRDMEDLAYQYSRHQTIDEAERQLHEKFRRQYWIQQFR